MRYLIAVLLLAGCVGGDPIAPEDIPPQNTEWGVRHDTASIVITIPNPLAPDTTGDGS